MSLSPSIVAIAGGSSPSLGRSLITAIIQSSSWTPVILSRTPSSPPWFSTLPSRFSPPEIRVVDYASPSSIQNALGGVHTLISVILAKDGTQTDVQIALAHAAVSAGVKRFASSEWALGTAGVMRVEMLRNMKSGVWDVCEKLAQSEQLEWARFNVGAFMNYLGIGCSQSGKGGSDEKEEEACAGVDREGDMPDGSGAFLISLGSATAEMLVNDEGQDVKVTFTEIGDIGRFVAAALDLPDGTWKRDMDIAGSTVRLGELIKIAETVTGRKFEVETFCRTDLEDQVSKLGEEKMLKKLWLELKLVCMRDTLGEGILEPMVNRLLPQISAVDVETYIRKYWG